MHSVCSIGLYCGKSSINYKGSWHCSTDKNETPINRSASGCCCRWVLQVNRLLSLQRNPLWAWKRVSPSQGSPWPGKLEVESWPRRFKTATTTTTPTATSTTKYYSNYSSTCTTLHFCIALLQLLRPTWLLCHASMRCTACKSRAQRWRSATSWCDMGKGHDRPPSPSSMADLHHRGMAHLAVKPRWSSHRGMLPRKKSWQKGLKSKLWRYWYTDESSEAS